jgi:hypothetical protein
LCHRPAIAPQPDWQLRCADRNCEWFTGIYGRDLPQIVAAF